MRLRFYLNRSKVRLASLEHTIALTPAQRYLIRELNVLFRETQVADLKSRIETLEPFVRRDPTAVVLAEFRRLRKDGVMGVPLVEELAKVFLRYSSQSPEQTDEQGHEVVAERIICSEALV